MLILYAVIAANALFLEVVFFTDCMLVLGEREKKMGLFFFFPSPPSGLQAT